MTIRREDAGQDSCRRQQKNRVKEFGRNNAKHQRYTTIRQEVSGKGSGGSRQKNRFKGVEGTLSSVEDTSKIANNFSEKTAAGVDDKIAPGVEKYRKKDVENNSFERQ